MAFHCGQIYRYSIGSTLVRYPTLSADSMTLRLPLLLVAALVSCTTRLASSYSIDIKSDSSECFIVTAFSPSSICTGSFEIITADPRPVVITVVGPPPKSELHFESRYKEDMKEDDVGKTLGEGAFSFDAELDGDYTMCISNGNSDNVGLSDGISRVVAFNFRMYSEKGKDYEYTGLETELNQLKEGLNSLKDHQSYINQREDMHKVTLDSINTKVLCWTILEAIILIAMAFWQISYITTFVETKRRL